MVGDEVARNHAVVSRMTRVIFGACQQFRAGCRLFAVVIGLESHFFACVCQNTGKSIRWMR